MLALVIRWQRYNISIYWYWNLIFEFVAFSILHCLHLTYSIKGKLVAGCLGGGGGYEGMKSCTKAHTHTHLHKHVDLFIHRHKILPGPNCKYIFVVLDKRSLGKKKMFQWKHHSASWSRKKNPKDSPHFMIRIC